MNKYVISVSILLLSASSSLAQDSCMVRPSCADMGYTKSATDCEGKKAIACPFDLSAYYCPEVGESCDFSEYPLPECPTNGNCTKLECGGATLYKLDSCQSGYVMKPDKASCQSCGFEADWYYSDWCPNNGYCEEVTCGGLTKYVVQDCYIYTEESDGEYWYSLPYWEAEAIKESGEHEICFNADICCIANQCSSYEDGILQIMCR
ncbi:MAG: hypothetical protein E7012_07160 [Alphaproteobacteria bacterium]|nr:hypothetical protein [Alphaproteobacteria bacterium]